jgi:hypothetical protein
MLIAKKIAKKRLVAYIVIMAVMLSGAIFFIYKNYSLTFKKTGPISGQAGPNEFQEPDWPGDNRSGGETSVSEADKIDLDYEILNSPRFKNLKDNSVGQSANPAH